MPKTFECALPTPGTAARKRHGRAVRAPSRVALLGLGLRLRLAGFRSRVAKAATGSSARRSTSVLRGFEDGWVCGGEEVVAAVQRRRVDEPAVAGGVGVERDLGGGAVDVDACHRSFR